MLGPRTFMDGRGRYVTSNFRRSETQERLRSENRFITTAAVQLTVTLNVPNIPSEGDQVLATGALSSPGGGYVIAAGVRAQGIRVFLASPLGTGPNSHSIRRALLTAQIDTFESALVGDVGVALTMVEADGKMSQVVAPGVEAESSAELLQQLSVNDGDVVHVAGADLVSPAGARAIVDWVTALPEGVKLVVSASPAVASVPVETWLQVLKRADLVTMNIREAAVLTTRLRPYVTGDWFQGVVRPNAGIVRRMGPLGCEAIEQGGAVRVSIPAFKAKPADTTGVGDIHIAVMCAGLLEGKSLVDACLRANAAAALELSHPTAFPVPTAAQVDRKIAEAESGEDCSDDADMAVMDSATGPSPARQATPFGSLL